MVEISEIEQSRILISDLIEKALSGEEVVIARDGTPLVKLVPVPAELEPRVPGRGEGKIWMSPDFEFTDKEIEELFERWDY